MTSKTRLRQQCQHRRQALSSAQRQQYAYDIAQHLKQYLENRDASPLNILCYRSIPPEVDTTNIFFQLPQHHYYAPVTHHSGSMIWRKITSETIWQRGNFGIPEPQHGDIWQANAGDTLLLCPLVGFDTRGNRIGMGKGCFDRWLSEHQDAIGHIIGLAFSCQQCDAIPAEQHDIPLHAVVTEKGWIACQDT